jgi:uncharacterized protein
MGYAAFLVFLIAYNNLANRWPPFNGPLYVPLNAVATAIVLVVGVAGFGLTAEQIGVRPDLGDLLLGFALGAIATAALSVGLAFPAGRRWLADERVAHLSGPALLYQVAIRIPIGTALFEEVAFRGVAFAALLQLGSMEAALVSSAAFGLWHIGPTLNLVEANAPDAGPAAKLRTIAGAIAFTSIAGLFLCWLRVETGNLSALVMLHATLNSGATLLAVRAHRMVGR